MLLLNSIYNNNNNNDISDNTHEDLQFHPSSIISYRNEENGATIIENVSEYSNIEFLGSSTEEVPVVQNLCDANSNTNFIIEVLDVPEYNTDNVSKGMPTITLLVGHSGEGFRKY